MIDSNWIVMTGAPCSGKSTVIQYLKDCGFSVCPEVAQAYIDEQQSRGVKEPWADKEKFQTEIYKRQRTAEAKLISEGKAGNNIFLDRGLPDGIAYFSYHGVPIESIPEAHLLARYKHVFLFERPQTNIQHDIDGEDPKQLVQLIKAEYTYHKIKLHNVPVMGIHERATYILQKSGLGHLTPHLNPECLPASKTLLPLYHHSGYYLRQRSNIKSTDSISNKTGSIPMSKLGNR